MRDPSFVQYIKDPKSSIKLNSEIKTGYATSLKNLQEMVNECADMGWTITSIHITGNPKNY